MRNNHVKIIGISVTVLLLVSLSFCIIANGSNTTLANNTTVKDDIKNVTVDKAKENIKKFTGKSNTELIFDRESITPHGSVFDLHGKDGYYSVNKKTGEIEVASFYQNMSDNYNVKIDEVTASKIAKDFIDQHDKGFSAKKAMKLKKIVLSDHGDAGKAYEIYWGEETDGVSLPGCAVVTLNPDNGKVISYVNVNITLDNSLSLKPQISKEDALKIALAQFKEIDSAQYEKNKLADPSPELRVVTINETQQKLVWKVIIAVRGPDYIQGGWVWVDASNGDVVLVGNVV